MDTIEMANGIKLTTGEVTLRVYDEPTIFDEIISLKDGPVQYERAQYEGVDTGNINL